MIAAIAIGITLLILTAVLVLRALLFLPKEKEFVKSYSVSVDAESAANSLSEMIRCKTVSNTDRSLEDEAEFKKFKELLPRLFPTVYEKCDCEEPTDRSILLRLRGKCNESPTVLMAHYDVVSANEDNWERAAFDGLIENGILWGRGTIDTKVTLNAILCAAEALLKQGFVPKRDIYFAFGGDEEINGDGAKTISELLKKRGIEPGMVLDEGGAVVKNAFPGVSGQCALIGIAEKGVANIEYSVRSLGGHSSAPTKNTPIERLSAACVRIRNKPFKFRLTEPAAEMIDCLGRHSAFGYRLIFANLWIFSPVLNMIAKRGGGELNALVRTTTAFTKMRGSEGMNVIPPVAAMVSNHRILPGDSVEDVRAHLVKSIKDKNVEVRIIEGFEPSRISLAEGEAWDRISKAVSSTWQGVIVSPYLMLACSDSKHYSKFSDKVYRFSPLALTKEERETIHGNNERISISQICESVEFYLRLIKES